MEIFVREYYRLIKKLSWSKNKKIRKVAHFLCGLDDGHYFKGQEYISNIMCGICVYCGKLEVGD